MSSSISIEQALVNHANARNASPAVNLSSVMKPTPTRAALPIILAERNHLSSQNSELWNHVRKQRHRYSLASNDVKRLRTERVQLRAKLEILM